MIKSFFVIAFRNLSRRKFFSVINVLGLAVAMAFSIVIFLWVQDERSVDQFHQYGSRLYRVVQTQHYQDGQVTSSDRTSAMLAAALKAELPEVERSVVLSQTDLWTFKVGEKVAHEKGCYSSEDLFQIFSFPLISGNTRNFLTGEDQIVISEKLAIKYFGERSPIGKPIRIDNRKDFFVSAVYADLPGNSSLQVDFVMSQKEYDQTPWRQDWQAIGDKTYVLLNEDAVMEAVNEKIRHFLKKKLPQTTDQLSLQRFSEVYLHENFRNGVAVGGRIDYVRMFTVVAMLILAVASINFMNLATAQSSRRSREVGIRKVVGASRWNLIAQFIGEAILTSCFAVVVALFIAELMLPAFNMLTEKHLNLHYAQPSFLMAVLALAVVTGIVSGSYPAVFLSALQPVKILKGLLKIKGGPVELRKVLVVVQFSISIIFIVATVVVFKQLQYIREKNLGVDRENVIYQIFEGDLTKNFNAFKTELLRSPAIQSVTYSNQPVLNIQYPNTWVEWPGKRSEVVFASAGVGYDFTQTLKINVKEGRDFSPEYPGDSLNVLINEEAARQMGLTVPLGHEITTTRDIVRKGAIIGVMKDFHLQSLHAPIEPMFIFLDTNPGFGYVTVRTVAGKTTEALQDMESVNKKYNPNFPFDYTFADDEFNRKHTAENLLSTLAQAFSFLTIFISCLGLFGLAAFTAEQRTKEIGIRKVLGASVGMIVRLMSTDFMRLILIALVLAIPMSGYLMHTWLQHYPYRIEITAWMLVAAGGVVVLVSAVTVSAQAIKAAFRNPVDSLKVE